MEVTKNNFQEVFPTIQSQIRKADFISFDFEFSGLGYNFGDKTNELDTVGERYEKLRQIIVEYGVVQAGVSIFRYNEESETLINSTYSCYLSGNYRGSYRYDTSSMTFLAENGFDFNKLFLQGLNFISIAEEKIIRDRREEQLASDESSNLFKIKIKDDQARTFFNKTVKKIQDSIETGVTLKLNGTDLNSFFRKIIFSNIAEKFPLSYFKKLPNWDVEVYNFSSIEEKNRFEDNLCEERLEEKLGFTRIVKEILEADVPLVGHNMLQDTMHFIQKFVCDLPEDLLGFRSIMRQNMPVIYDTKLLSHDYQSDLANKSLGPLFADLVQKCPLNEIVAEEDGLSYKLQEDGQSHDAGYDAFMTGVCFVAMVKKAEGKKFCKKNDLMGSKYLKDYESKINFMQSYDISCLNVIESSPVADRSHIYSVTCPSNFTNSKIKELFSILDNPKISWVNDSHFHVLPLETPDINNAKRNLPKFQAKAPPNVKVSMYKYPLLKNSKKSPPAAVLKRNSPGPDNSRSKAKKMRDDSLEKDENDSKAKKMKDDNFGSENSQAVDQEQTENDEINSTDKNVNTSSDQQYFTIPDEW